MVTTRLPLPSVCSRQLMSRSDLRWVKANLPVSRLVSQSRLPWKLAQNYGKLAEFPSSRDWLTGFLLNLLSETGTRSAKYKPNATHALIIRALSEDSQPYHLGVLVWLHPDQRHPCDLYYLTTAGFYVSCMHVKALSDEMWPLLGHTSLPRLSQTLAPQYPFSRLLLRDCVALTTQIS